MSDMNAPSQMIAVETCSDDKCASLRPLDDCVLYV